MKKQILSLTLAVVLVLSLAAPVLAVGPTFSDVPESYWGYADIEAVAEAGLMNGTGNGAFSPEVKVSVAQFLTLLGRLVFPETQVNEGDTWYGPYVSACNNSGLLDGTQVNINDVEAEISRYDMAVILRAAAKKLGKAETLAQQSQVADFGMIPNMYTEAVLAVYGMGLIKGDQAGNFNGANTMMRAEVATVIMRLAKAKPGSGSQGGTTDPGTTTKPEKPSDGATYHLEVVSHLDVLVPGETTHLAFGGSGLPYPVSSNNFDRTGFTCTSSAPDVVAVTGTLGTSDWQLTATGVGTATITVTDPYGVSGSTDVIVVDKRDGIGTKTFQVSIWSAYYLEPSPKGNAYGKTTYVSDVPYKIYYTRDGGKTSQLVYEGITSEKNLQIELELPEDSFYSETAGLYMSAEAMINGQRMVTSDLRTDGRAYLDLHKGSTIDSSFTFDPALTPPDGVKAHFTFAGYVERFGNEENPHPEGFKVQLHYKDGSVLGEAITQADGVFSMDCAVDALDGGFQKYEKLYYVTVEGTASDGTKYHHAPQVPLENYTMRSLVDLRIEASEGVSTDHNFRVSLTWRDIVEN